MKITFTSVIWLLAIVSLCFGQTSYKYSQPQSLSDGWKTNSLHSLEVDTARVHKLFSQLKNGKHKLHSTLLVRNNSLIIEEYFDNNSINTQHDLRSATKSITSLLIGIAIDKKLITSVDDPISKYLNNLKPEKNADAWKEDITIRHLLTMSSGLDCNDWDKKSKGQEDRVYKKKNWLQYFLDLPMNNAPGTVSNYCTMGQILATEIVSRASGMPIDKFAEKYLFHPLGITNLSWGHTSKKEVIASGKRLYMTPRDMAKVGQLILNKGLWDNKQVVSKKWIDESTSGQTKLAGLDYGFLWWNIPLKTKEIETLSITATGNGGQYIMLIPELDMVAVFTGGAYNSQEGKLPFAIMTDIFLPTFTIER
ncbi:MAG: serine hydrolase domain-containing protein [Calditrichia bacterium]